MGMGRCKIAETQIDIDICSSSLNRNNGTEMQNRKARLLLINGRIARREWRGCRIIHHQTRQQKARKKTESRVSDPTRRSKNQTSVQDNKVYVRGTGRSTRQPKIQTGD
jgi:hypothetical protein